MLRVRADCALPRWLMMRPISSACANDIVLALIMPSNRDVRASAPHKQRAIGGSELRDRRLHQVLDGAGAVVVIRRGADLAARAAPRFPRPRRVGIDGARAHARFDERDQIVDHAAMPDDLGVTFFGALDRRFFNEALRDSVIGAPARAFELGLELFAVERRQRLPARALRLVDAEVLQFRGCSLRPHFLIITSAVSLFVVRHYFEQLTSAALGAHPDLGRLRDQRGVLGLLGVDLHGDRFVVDALDLSDAVRFRQSTACRVIFGQLFHAAFTLRIRACNFTVDLASLTFLDRGWCAVELAQKAPSDESGTFLFMRRTGHRRPPRLGARLQLAAAGDELPPALTECQPRCDENPRSRLEARFVA